MEAPQNGHGRTLFIDADDTLWENNIYFEEVIADFCTMLSRHSFKTACTGELMRSREDDNIRKYGYGSMSLYQTMQQIYQEFCAREEREPEPSVYHWIDEARKRTYLYEIRFLEGVKESLPLLREKNQLVLLTKGYEDEQMGKIERSGIRQYFHHIRIVPDKHQGTYRALLQEFRIPAESAWMIGNSPRSDINPARSAGLGTVLIPYHSAWSHEEEELVDEGRKTMVLPCFSQLVEHFC